MRTTVTVSLITLLVGIGLASWFFLRPNASGTSIDTSRAAVVKEMRQIGRLETASFTIEKIIEAKKEEGGPWRDILFGDKLLLIAHGEVVAGFDFANLTEANVRTTGGTLRLELPAPQILSVRLDNEQTRVYDRSQGFLARGNKDLETEARQAAEKEIRDAACQADILEAASANATKQIKALMGAFGFSETIVEIPVAEC